MTGTPRHGPPDRVVAALLCPVCRDGLSGVAGSLRCDRGHAFDVARQGYVNLLQASVGSADTAAMVADRVGFLAAGHYRPLAEAVAGLVCTDGLVVDAGAGPGYYLGAVLDRMPDATGLAMDVSPAALRRAARSHERLGAVVWDVWKRWPVRDGAADVLLNVFAPRNGPEFRRVLRPGGLLLVVTPDTDHLAELGSAGLLTVDPRKAQRLAGTLGDGFDQMHAERVRYPMTLDPPDLARVIGMGPAGHHERPAPPDHPCTVTASFVLAVYSAR